MVSEDPGAKGLPEPSCVGFGFEALDFVADALICPAARPFGLGRERFVDVWQAVEDWGRIYSRPPAVGKGRHG